MREREREMGGNLVQCLFCEVILVCSLGCCTFWTSFGLHADVSLRCTMQQSEFAKKSWRGMNCKGLYNVGFWLIERWGVTRQLVAPSKTTLMGDAMT